MAVTDLVQRWADAWSTDVDALLALFLDDCVYEDVTMGVVNHGKGELRTFAAGLRTASPDFRVEINAMFGVRGRGECCGGVDDVWHAEGRLARDARKREGVHGTRRDALPGFRRQACRGPRLLGLGNGPPTARVPADTGVSIPAEAHPPTTKDFLCVALRAVQGQVRGSDAEFRGHGRRHIQGHPTAGREGRSATSTVVAVKLGACPAAPSPGLIPQPGFPTPQTLTRFGSSRRLRRSV